MKKNYNLLLAFISCAFSASTVSAQNICMVTADYNNADSYMIIWSQIDDMTNLDSVYVYRWSTSDPTYLKIGAVDISSSAPTYFTDINANVIEANKYKIAYLDSNGALSGFSPYHKPAVLDYEPLDGTLSWSIYEKEGVTASDAILGHEVLMDETGLNLSWSPISTSLIFSDIYYTDQGYASHPNARYELLVALDNCDFQTKANINRSRSNIKQQFSNASASIQQLDQFIGFTVFPNPTNSMIEIKTENKQGAHVKITSVDGKVAYSVEISNGTSTLDINELKRGVYFIVLEQNGKTSSQKLIKY